MSQMGKTVTFLIVAAGLTAAAVFASIPRSSTVDDFRDQGQLFFPDFHDPSLCTSLEVVEVDPSTAEAQVFKVMKRDGRWVIPSHMDYPADAKDRLANTAGQVIELTRDTVRSSRSEDHASLGVLDPLEGKTGNIEGLGKRITLRDQSDAVLADYIIGKDVPNRPGQKFVRRPDQVRTYAVNVKAEPSTRFTDWIEPNVLKAEGPTIRRLIFDNRKVDTERGELLPGEKLSIRREADGAPWTMEKLPAGQEVDPTKTTALINALADLKVVGIRPKPAGLAAALARETQDRPDNASFRSLTANGFYLTKTGLIPAEGSLLVGCEDGVVYNLQFGRVTFAKGEALSAGKGEDTAKDAIANEKDAAKGKAAPDAPKDGAVESRYLFVTAAYDPTAVPEPKAPKALEPGEFPQNVFRKSSQEIKAEQDKLARDIAEWKKRTETGQARALALSKRFAPWYYLVPGTDYRSLVLPRKELVREHQPESEATPGFNPSQPPRSPSALPRFPRPGR